MSRSWLLLLPQRRAVPRQAASSDITPSAAGGCEENSDFSSASSPHELMLAQQRVLGRG